MANNSANSVVVDKSGCVPLIHRFSKAGKGQIQPTVFGTPDIRESAPAIGDRPPGDVA